MILVVGLGNPGKKYEKTRHNIGFRAVEEFQKKNNFPDFKLVKKFKSEISEGFLNNKKIILAKPQTFMNNSGRAVKLLIKKSSREKLINSAMAELLSFNLLVIHDDINLPLGKIRIVKNRGAGGHKGVESIIKELGTKDFVRFRIGVQPKYSTFRTAVKNIEKFVLQKFNKEEEKIVKEITKKTAEAVELFFKEGLEKTMNKFNK